MVFFYDRLYCHMTDLFQAPTISQLPYVSKVSSTVITTTKSLSRTPRRRFAPRRLSRYIDRTYLTLTMLTCLAEEASKAGQEGGDYQAIGCLAAAKSPGGPAS
jgi:hypothetical protein